MSAEFNITKIRENKLLTRRELVLELKTDTTPTRQSVRELVARQLGVDIAGVYVRKIETTRGSDVVKAEVHVYQNPEVAKAIEPLYIIARNLGEEGKKLLEAKKKKK